MGFKRGEGVGLIELLQPTDICMIFLYLIILEITVSNTGLIGVFPDTVNTGIKEQVSGLRNSRLKFVILYTCYIRTVQ